ncbi:MAG: ERF family protein, partial [Candidatus Methanomethylicaceae archaeon]
MAKFARAVRNTKNPLSDKLFPHFGYKYATLKAVFSSIRGALDEVGLSLIQLTSFDSTCIIIETRIIDSESGEEVSFPMKYPLVDGYDSDIKKCTSMITTYRRHALLTLFGLVGEEEPAEVNEVRNNTVDSTQQTDNMASKTQVGKIWVLIKEAFDNETARKVWAALRPSELTKQEAHEIIRDFPKSIFERFPNRGVS